MLMSKLSKYPRSPIRLLAPTLLVLATGRSEDVGLSAGLNARGDVALHTGAPIELVAASGEDAEARLPWVGGEEGLPPTASVLLENEQETPGASGGVDVHTRDGPV